MRPNREHARAFLLVTLALVFGGHFNLAQAPALNVDANALRHPISPEIYGIANYGLDAGFAKEIQVPNVRWGGDATTRYNWLVDSSNSGFDWYFMGGNGQTTAVPSASADLMVNTYKPANALITIPIIPYINKLSAWNCSFPVSVYGAQQSSNPYVHPNGDNCGNSIASNGTQLTDNNIYANHIDNTTSLQQQWVQHLVSTFGTAAKGGVKFYQLDNEPYGWSNTHRDVMPNGATYPTITQLGQQYAATVKQADSTALVLGPSDFTLGGWIGNTGQQGGVFAGQYYLQQMAAYDKAHGQRILDYFDEHYYFDTSTPAAQLASTRTLWDSTYNGGTWVEQYDFNGPMQLIPRFRGWISANYPGTLLSLSEYSIDSGKKSIVDAIAEMDVLGIFGREPLDFANMWSAPGAQDPIAFAFRMFRNYDGHGSQFGDTSISAASTNQGQLSIYAAQRSTDNAVTILVINKTTGALTSAIALSNLALPATAQVYDYSQASLTSIAHPSDATITGGSLSYTFPGYSAVMFVVQPATAATTATSLTASAAQINLGQSVIFTVGVVPSAGAAPTGTVTLLDGSTSLGTASLSNGAATFTITSLTAGTHSITASYAGDSADGASTSSAVSVQVNGAQLQSTAVTLVASPASGVSGQAISLTASVTPASATGTISFKDGSSTIGSANLVAGKGTFSVSTLSVGTHSLTAAYSGDSVDSPASSNTVTVTITASTSGPSPDYGLTLSSNTLAMSQGTSGSLTVSVAPQNGFSASLSFACSGLPSGWGCSFAPATLSGGTPQSTKMTVSVSNSSRLMPTPSGLVFALVSPLPLFWFGLAGKSPKGRWMLFCFLLALAGCGTSSNSTQQQSQSSTYNVTVTASGSSAPSHSQTFTLTMNR
jgi:Glycoside hydrolase family 44/Bacterial Ig-like domain (group 3)